jgi:SAM-dependent methyltransferase
MLKQAKRNGAKRPAVVRERLTLHQADMACFTLPAAFPLVIIPYSAFQHLTTPERQRAALTCIHRHLAPGGHLVVDVFDPLLEHCIPGAASPIPDRDGVDPASGHLIRRRTLARDIDPIRQTIAETFRVEIVSTSGGGACRDRNLVRDPLGLPSGDGLAVRAEWFRGGRAIFRFRALAARLWQATDLGRAPAVAGCRNHGAWRRIGHGVAPGSG